MAVNIDTFWRIALAFPGADHGFSMGSPMVKVNGKVLARLIGGTEAMFSGLTSDEIDMMVEADPAVFHATSHYRDAGCILARLAALDAATLSAYLEQRFRRIACKAEVKAFEERTAS